MPLTHSPVPISFIALHNMFPNSIPRLAAGNTIPPSNYLEPKFVIEQQPGNFYKLRVTQRASEGRNDSYYVTGGLFETAFTLDTLFNPNNPDDLRQIAGYVVPWVEGRPRIYLFMPQDIGTLNSRAEKEHCEDMVYAFKVTLGQAQQALDFIANQRFGPYPTPDKAKAEIEKQFSQRVEAVWRPLGLNMTSWKQKYEKLVTLTGKRDANHWHSFGVELVKNEAKVNLPKPTFTGRAAPPESGRIVLQFTRGETQIDVHPSQQVIV